MSNREKKHLKKKTAKLNQTLFSKIIELAVEAIISMEDGKIILFNKGAENIFGYKTEEVIGQPLDMLIPVRFRKDHTAHIKDFAKSTTVSRPMSDRKQIIGLRKNGEEFLVEASIVKSVVEGSKIFTALLRDISERMQAELAKEKAERRLRVQYTVTQLLVESSSIDDAISSILKAICEILDWKEGAIWKVGAKLGLLECTEIWHKPGLDLSDFVDASRQLKLERGKSLPGRVWAKEKSQWVENLQDDPRSARAPAAKKSDLHSAFAFPIHSGKFLYGVMEFLTNEKLEQDGELLRVASGIGAQIGQFIQRKHLSEQLVQSQKMETVGTLASGIAHDLNNQLTPILGYIDLILDQLKPEDPHYELLSSANRATERCVETVQRLLRFSRPSSNKKAVLDLKNTCHEFKETISKFLPSTIQIDFGCEADLFPVEADDTELQTVLMNLAVNARDAMPQGGHLKFEARNVDLSQKAYEGGHSGHFILIAVTDTGTGIPPEIKKRIFEPFFTTKEPGRGVGLGLAMAFKIIHDHKGWIDVSSQIGRGSTFHIYLPAQKDVALPIAATHSASIERLKVEDKTILLADDEEELCAIGKVLLERLGYRVIIARNGEEVVSLYRAHVSEIDALLIDMTMPKLSGLQAIEQILAINKSAKIIIVSGYNTEGSYEDVIKRGAVDFIQKPYTIKILADVLKKHCTA